MRPSKKSPVSNARRAAAAGRLPASAGIAGDEDSAGKHGRRAADGPALPLGQEADLSQGRQQHRFALPVQSAVARAEHDPGAIVQIGIRHAARGPAVAGIDETDGVQRAGHAGGLGRPMLTAVVGMQDHAEIADGPAMLRIDEADIAQPGVVRLDAAGGRFGTLRSGDPILGSEDSPVRLGRRRFAWRRGVRRLGDRQRGQEENSDRSGHKRPSVDG